MVLSVELILLEKVIYAVKILLSAIILVTVNELGKRSTTLAAMILALPIVSIIAFVWEWVQTKDAERIASLSNETFWFVLPTLPMFLLLSWLLRQGQNFYVSVGISALVTATLFATTQYLLQRFS